MYGQLSIQTCDEPPERMRMIGLNTELFTELPVYSLDDLSGGVDDMPGLIRDLLTLVAPWGGF